MLIIFNFFYDFESIRCSILACHVLARMELHNPCHNLHKSLCAFLVVFGQIHLLRQNHLCRHLYLQIFRHLNLLEVLVYALENIRYSRLVCPVLARMELGIVCNNLHKLSREFLCLLYMNY